MEGISFICSSYCTFHLTVIPCGCYRQENPIPTEQAVTCSLYLCHSLYFDLDLCLPHRSMNQWDVTKWLNNEMFTKSTDINVNKNTPFT